MTTRHAYGCILTSLFAYYNKIVEIREYFFYKFKAKKTFLMKKSRIVLNQNSRQVFFIHIYCQVNKKKETKQLHINQQRIKLKMNDLKVHKKSQRETKFHDGSSSKKSP